MLVQLSYAVKLGLPGRVELPFSVPVTISGLEDRLDYGSKLEV